MGRRSTRTNRSGKGVRRKRSVTRSRRGGLIDMNSVRLWTDRAHEQRDQVQAAMQTIHQLQQMLQTQQDATDAIALSRERIQTELDDCLSHHSTILARTRQQLTESRQEVEELKIRLRGGAEYTALGPSHQKLSRVLASHRRLLAAHRLSLYSCLFLSIYQVWHVQFAKRVNYAELGGDRSQGGGRMERGYIGVEGAGACP